MNSLFTKCTTGSASKIDNHSKFFIVLKLLGHFLIFFRLNSGHFWVKSVKRDLKMCGMIINAIGKRNRLLFWYIKWPPGGIQHSKICFVYFSDPANTIYNDCHLRLEKCKFRWLLGNYSGVPNKRVVPNKHLVIK